MNCKTFYRLKDGIISDVVQTGGNIPAGDGWLEGPNSLIKHKLEKRDWFDQDMKRIDDETLARQGRRKDNRGVWYNKEKREDTVTIQNYDETAPDGYTKEAPLENEAHQYFDGAKNKWVVDTEKKERTEKENRISQLKYQIDNADRSIVRPLKSVQKKRTAFEKYLTIDSMQANEKNLFLETLDEETINDFEKFIELDNLVEKNLRPEMQRLKEELKTA